MPRPPAPAAKPVSSRGPSLWLIGGVVALAIALIAVLVWAATRGGPLDSPGSSSALPEGGGISVGPGRDADVMQIQVYEDFQCPWCGRLEHAIGEGLQARIDAGEANVTYQIMSFLDGKIGNDSSVRAANAAVCADDAGIFAPFHASVYEHMPTGEGTGYTDELFVQLAQEAGLSGQELETFETCMSDLTHRDYVADMQQRANEDGVTGTPTVVVDGTTLSNEELSRLLEDPSSLDAILDANASR